MNIILDLIGISWLFLLINEHFKKGNTLTACILGAIYSCIMMILAVPGPPVIFILISIIFIYCTVRLITINSYNEWKSVWANKSKEDSIERNLSYSMFLKVKLYCYFSEKHAPSRLSNFIPVSNDYSKMTSAVSEIRDSGAVTTEKIDEIIQEAESLSIDEEISEPIYTDEIDFSDTSDAPIDVSASGLTDEILNSDDFVDL